ncbi:hypothetical protein [Sutcliffiella horikoshii]|uniref:hypothetical protein n=1 Tax=Sutcliffiella horikoshii TaxID=79883 RepID=UPI0012F8D6BD|nr:hypothetical protein [Sutcliffiella horikoshii]
MMHQRTFNEGDRLFQSKSLQLNRVEDKKHTARQYSKKHLFFLKLQYHQVRNMN